MTHRVVITGMGTVNPIGLTVDESWENCVNGVSGIGPITLFDASELPVKIAGEVKNFDPSQYMKPAEVRRRDRYEQFATAAAKQALAQAGLEITPDNAARIGSVVSSSVGGLRALEEAVHTLRDFGSRRINPFVIPMLMSNGASGLIGIDTGAKGPAMSVASACASGADGIGLAWRMIRAGELDAAFAGDAEATVCAIGVASFDRLGAMSRRNGGHELTPQPFDKDRDGLVMGEGGAVILLESLENAQARGAEILAELVGYAATADAFHITAPAEDGAGSASAMVLAARAAGVNLDEIDYINAHGTGTPLNDTAETVAIKRAFGQKAYDVPISSTKSMTGHMMGATGAVEAVFCVQAIRAGVIPPTINYRTPDPTCDLDYVPNTAREKKVRVAMSNAFGFGGHNAVLVIREFTG